MLLSRSEVVAKVSLSKFFLTCFSSRSSLRTRHVGYGDNDKTDFFIKTTYSGAELQSVFFQKLPDAFWDTSRVKIIIYIGKIRNKRGCPGNIIDKVHQVAY